MRQVKHIMQSFTICSKWADERVMLMSRTEDINKG
jgi:hypothetical protein